MSELMYRNPSNKFLRGTLLTTVSGLALLVSIGMSGGAKAEDVDHPTVWIELGGQLERMVRSEETFTPEFLSKFDHLNLAPALPQQRPPLYSNGAEGKISFVPEDTGWVFSAGIRYGRANGERTFNQQLPKLPAIKGKNIDNSVYYITQKIPYHLNSNTQHTDRHLLLDFQVGKDVGLGVFGSKGASVMSLGVRFAQFTSSRSANLNGAPDFTVIGTSKKYGLYRSRHHYTGAVTTDGSFHGVGPSLSWDASASIVGRDDDSQVTMDWGINAAVLFGRQKVDGETNATGSHYTNYTKVRPPQRLSRNNFVVYQHATNFDRSRRVIVPNVGGFAGVSFRYSDVKVSMGYRADIYFGAMDSGIDVRKTYDRSFYGPFATISIGLGG
jgi:hypothetical protein